MTQQPLSVQLNVVNGKVVTNSLHLSEVFEKRHADTLRSIDEILTQVDDSFGKRNFALSEYTVTNNLGFTVTKPMYLLTRDGFTLLAMGFTGKRALEFKITYINAFNAMEQELVAQANPPVLSNREYQELRRLVWIIENCFHMKGGAGHAVNATLREHLGISSVLKIPVERRAAAVALIADLEKAAFAFKRGVIELERRFFRSRFKEIPAELLVEPSEDQPAQSLMTF